MTIDIITLGSIKEKYLQDAIKDYKKRLSKYIKLNIIELKEVRGPKQLNDTLVTQMLDEEYELILKCLKPNTYIFALAIEGKHLTSESLTQKINQVLTYSSGHITFIIGSSHGLSEKIKAKANYLLSFSTMTFPHQLMRVILLEQLYRAMKIKHNEPYHK
ncbi:MAG: 23S rRNA (pseudouridine(1915)-N(3))-methyltransferase RlmH [Bacillota bacterium]